MRVSVIIPSLNSPTLARALTAVAAQTESPDEIIVVGRDNTNIVSGFPSVRFIDTQVPVCAARARNIGMSAATGDIFLFLDSDCIPHSNWLASHLACHAAGGTIVGGSVELRGNNYWAQSDNVSMFHEFVPELPAGPRFLLPTLNLSVRREIFIAVGGMDESFPGAAAEDADWTIRIRKTGHRLWFDPLAVVAHSPARTAWTDVVRHWNNLGHNAIRVRLRYANDFATPQGAYHSWWWRSLSPFIALRVTAQIFAKKPLWRYWLHIPVIYATKLIYCFGAAKAIDSGFATQP